MKTHGTLYSDFCHTVPKQGDEGTRVLRSELASRLEKNQIKRMKYILELSIPAAVKIRCGKFKCLHQTLLLLENKLLHKYQNLVIYW